MRSPIICFALATVLLSPCVSAQWVPTDVPYGGSVERLVVSGTSLFAGTTAGVFLSTNNGTSWTAVNTGLTNTYVYGLCVSGTTLFAETGTGVFLSTNNGTDWTAANTPFPDISRTIQLGLNLFAVTRRGGVFLSTNNGTSWTSVNSGLTNTYVLDIAVSGTNVFAGTGRGVFLSTNNGTSWTPVNTGLADSSVSSLAVCGTNLFAGTWGGIVFLSTNNGASWAAANNGLTTPHLANLRSLVVSGTNLFAGTDGFFGAGSGVFLTANNGTSWTTVNNGLTNTRVQAIAVTDTYIFAGTGYGVGGVWRRPLSEMTTAVESLSDLPECFSLEQNYPNPFNPTTKIQFTIVNRQLTIVKVYDVLGREVATLVNEVKEPGTYTVRFDGSNLASGVYLYRLTAGEFVATKGMLILK